MLRYDDAYYGTLESRDFPGIFGRVSRRVQMAFGLSSFSDRTTENSESPSGPPNRQRNTRGLGEPEYTTRNTLVTPKLGRFEKLILFLTGNRNAIMNNETILYAQETATKFTELQWTMADMFPDSDPITARVRGTYHNIPPQNTADRARAKQVSR